MISVVCPERKGNVGDQSSEHERGEEPAERRARPSPGGKAAAAVGQDRAGPQAGRGRPQTETNPATPRSRDPGQDGRKSPLRGLSARRSHVM